MGRSSNQRESGRTKVIILILLLITAAAVCVSVWALFFRSSGTALTPDYAPRETEANAEPIGDDDEEKLEAEEGGGAISLTYSNSVTISLSDKTASLYFANPSRSIQSMVLQIVIQDEVIVQSGTLKPGNQVTTLELLSGAAEKLSEGGYDGKFVVLYYDPDSGEKAIVNTEIPISVTVNK